MVGEKRGLRGRRGREGGQRGVVTLSGMRLESIYGERRERRGEGRREEERGREREEEERGMVMVGHGLLLPEMTDQRMSPFLFKGF